MEPGTAAAAVAATAVALGRSEPASVAARTGPRARLAREDAEEDRCRRHGNRGGGGAGSASTMIISLVSLCRNAVVGGLERYPPESFQILSEEDFDEIVQLRHHRTAPKEGSGGLDGTGRVAPALSDKFVIEVERVNPHLAESSVVDQLVWRDCVNFRFREGGLTRPSALALPWPLLVDKVRSSAEVLCPTGGAVGVLDSPRAGEALRELEACPMNVSLLQATGVGKTVRKCIKSHRHRTDRATSDAVERLERLLRGWMDVAEHNSAIAATAPAPARGGSTTTAPATTHEDDAERDLRMAESCQSWRQLFRALKGREESCRTVQGERMRKIRSNLARNRPKVVKVRPAPAKPPSSRLLSRIDEGKVITPSSTPANSPAAKMSKLWRETAVAAHRSQRPAAGPAGSPPPFKRAAATSLLAPSSSSSSSSFGAAVAFAAAAASSSSSKRPASKGSGSKPSLKARSTLVQLSGGKLMRVPKHNPSAVAATTASLRARHAPSRPRPPPPPPPPSSSGTAAAPPFRRGGDKNR